MTWGKPRKYVGGEIPRGPVWVSYDAGPDPLPNSAECFVWSDVVCYRLPDTLEGRREADRIRKADSRAKQGRLDMPLPQGTAEALDRITAAAGYGDRRELIAWLIHSLDRDRHALAELSKMTVRAGDLSKFYPLIGAEVPEDED